MLNCLISHGIGNDMKEVDKDKSIPSRKSSSSLSRGDNPIKMKDKKSQDDVSD
jgi:hypothetical protein